MFKDRDCYRVQWRERGKRISKNFLDRDEAKRFELELKLGIVSGHDVKSQNPLFKDFAEKWLAEYSKVEKANTSHDQDCLVVKRHLLEALGLKNIKALRKSDLVELKAKLLTTTAYQKTTPLSAKTVNNILMVAKKIMGYAVDLGVIPENPWRTVKPCKLTQGGFDFWTIEEREDFYRKAYKLSPDLADVAYLACQTGLRRGELAALTWASIDLDRRKLRVGASYSVRLKTYGPTKGKDISEVSLNQDAIAVLERRLLNRTGPSVFPIHLFKNLRRDFGVLCRRAGSRAIRFHDTRHSFASALAMSGVDLMVIQKLMRHKSYQMTLRYAHLHPSHLDGATDCLARGLARKEDLEVEMGRKSLKRWRTLSDSNARPSGSKPVILVS